LLLQCQDLGEERRRTQAVARLQEQLAHGLSHELRAPLRSITGFAARLDESGAVREADRPDLERIRAAAARADALVQALLELLRASRQPMRAEAVDVSLLCEWVAAELQDADPGRAAQVQVAPGLWALGDEHWIKVLLHQVFDNAWKFSSDSGQVRITVEGAQEGDRLRLSVSDQGRGFDMRYAYKLFLPFQRLHGSNQGGGHGLGLAIARQVGERHGRRTRPRSHPGQGCTLFIQPHASSHDAELTRIAFAQAGIDRQLVVVRDGAEALDYLFATGAHAGRDARQLPAIVLLDLNLPKLDGREVLQAIRGDERTRALPVVVLTTSDEP